MSSRQTSRLRYLPHAIVAGIAVALLAHVPILQFENLHDYADRRSWLGVPNAADVLSNAGLTATGLAGMLLIWLRREHPALAPGWPGYLLFAAALALTGIGSAYYHWEPNDARLIWDRLPIALLCAGLLIAVHAETRPAPAAAVRTILPLALLSASASVSVAWWAWTADLRPYLLIQLLPMVLVPVWQALAKAPRADRIAFSAAIAFNLASKAAELLDHPILAFTQGWMSGHTLKHLLATLAALLIVGRLMGRMQETHGGMHRRMHEDRHQ